MSHSLDCLKATVSLPHLFRWKSIFKTAWIQNTKNYYKLSYNPMELSCNEKKTKNDVNLSSRRKEGFFW